VGIGEEVAGRTQRSGSSLQGGGEACRVTMPIAAVLPPSPAFAHASARHLCSAARRLLAACPSQRALGEGRVGQV